VEIWIPVMHFLTFIILFKDISVEILRIYGPASHFKVPLNIKSAICRYVYFVYL